MKLIPDFAYAMTCEDAIEVLPLSEGTVEKLYRVGVDVLLAHAWPKLTVAQRHEVAAVAAREEAYCASIVEQMLA